MTAIWTWEDPPLISPHLTPCQYHHSDSFYELNILKVTSRGSQRTHTWPLMNVQYSIFLSFFLPRVFSWSLQQKLWKRTEAWHCKATEFPVDVGWIFTCFKVSSTERRNISKAGVNPKGGTQHRAIKSLEGSFKSALWATCWERMWKAESRAYPANLSGV